MPYRILKTPLPIIHTKQVTALGALIAVLAFKTKRRGVLTNRQEVIESFYQPVIELSPFNGFFIIVTGASHA